MWCKTKSWASVFCCVQCCHWKIYLVTEKVKFEINNVNLEYLDQPHFFQFLEKKFRNLLLFVNNNYCIFQQWIIYYYNSRDWIYYINAS